MFETAVKAENDAALYMDLKICRSQINAGKESVMAKKKDEMRKILISICATVILLCLLLGAVWCVPWLLPDYKNQTEEYTAALIPADTHPDVYPWNLYENYPADTIDVSYTGPDESYTYLWEWANHFLQVFFTDFKSQTNLNNYRPLGALDLQGANLELQRETGICYARDIEYAAQNGTCKLDIAFWVEQSLFFHISRADRPDVTLNEMEAAEKEITGWIEQIDFDAFASYGDTIPFREVPEPQNPFEEFIKTLFLCYLPHLEYDKYDDSYVFVYETFEMLRQKEYTCMYYDTEILIQFGNSKHSVVLFYSPVDRLVTGFSLQSSAFETRYVGENQESEGK